MKLKIDLHVHSSYSKDAFVSVKSVVLKLKSLGYHGFALTDHDTLEGNREAFMLARRYGLSFIPSAEIKSSEGDIIGLCMNEPVRKGLCASETIELIHRQGAIAVAAHPYSVFLHPFGIGDLVKKLPVDAIEVLNPRTYIGNKKAEQAALETKKPMTAGSDSHTLPEVGSAWTLVDSENNMDSILKAIKSGRTEPHGRLIHPLNAFSWYCKRARKKILQKK